MLDASRLIREGFVGRIVFVEEKRAGWVIHDAS